MSTMGRISAKHEEELLLKQDAAEELFDACRDAWNWMSSMSPDLRAQNEVAVRTQLVKALKKARGQ